jgi:hypothetical protein
LHQDGVLTDEELDRARAAVLVAPPVNPTAEQLDELRRHGEAARLDREWEAEREKYIVTGRFGYRYIPGRTSSTVLGVLNVAFGVVWVVVSARYELPGYFLVIGIVVAVVGVGGSAHLTVKAGRYVEARRRYQQRRAAVLNRGDTVDPPR